MPAVPRLLNRVYDKINNEISNSPIKKMLFRMALNSKESELRRGIIRRNSIWDKLIFKKVQEAFGGQLRLMVIGSVSFLDFFLPRVRLQDFRWSNKLFLINFIIFSQAPLAGPVLTFTRCALGCLVVEGYGQTECVAAVTLTVTIFKTSSKTFLITKFLQFSQVQGDFVPDHVGPPLACCCIKLVDVPEMEYYQSNQQGEICVKGTCVFKG